MTAKKTILLNGFITLIGLLLDIYGLYDLSFYPAMLGLIVGIVDCVTFVWMREETKDSFAQWRKDWNKTQPYMIDRSLEERKERKAKHQAPLKRKKKSESAHAFLCYQSQENESYQENSSHFSFG